VFTRIKWPNDILAEKGKIAGILIEHGITGSRISHSIIGIGLNLNQIDFPEFPLPASSVILEKGLKQKPQVVAHSLEQHLQNRYDKLEEGKTGELEQEYLAKLYLINQVTEFRSGRETFQGVLKKPRWRSGVLMIMGNWWLKKRERQGHMATGKLK